MFTLESLMNKGLSEEHAKMVMQGIDNDYRPASKFNERGDELKALKDDLETKQKTIIKREEQINEIKEQLKDNKELQEKIDELQEQNEKEKKEREKFVEKMKFDRGLEKELKEKYGAKNYKAVKALLDLESIKKDGKDFLGLKEQVEPLLESDEYLFNVENNSLKGRKLNKGNDEKIPTKEQDNPFDNNSLNLSKQAELLKTDTKRAKVLIEQAGKDPSVYNL